jgi:putative transposase
MGGALRQNDSPKGDQNMPWNETNIMDQRTEFAQRAISGTDSFSDVCRDFGISRKTGYKWKERFLENGAKGMGDHSRRPNNSPNEVSEAIVCRIVKLRMAHPNWGARKLRTVLERTISQDDLPSETSFKRILDKAGMVKHRRRRPSKQTGRLQTPVKAQRPNHVWTIDFKGWWYTRDKKRFEPLTIRDDYSRYILCAQALDNACGDTVRQKMIRVFERHGLPEVIRSDNGPPFAAPNSPLGLSRLSTWWLSLGIDLDRIAPGRPDQNGGHERMHRDIACEVEGNVQQDAAMQQALLDEWRDTFNQQRPHEALEMRVPQDFYQRSQRKFDASPVELEYPSGYLVRKVNGTGRIKIHGTPIPISTALHGFEVGLQPSKANNLSLWFCRLYLGEIDLSTQKFHVITPNS